MTTSPNPALTEPLAEHMTCALCDSTFASEPGPEVCGPCLYRFGYPGAFATSLAPSYRRELRTRWLREARLLRSCADLLRPFGYPESASEARRIAGLYRLAAGMVR